mmetsp:Transcript_55775/g.153817  ORF Transcript_55775/g.153817 Transcript_55775/m.153817 type:complete len:221 (-) Transcript_55775:857-1519(-)
MGSYAAAALPLLLRRRIATTPATTRAKAAPTTARVALSLPASPVTPAAAIEVAAVAQFGDETMGWPSVSVCSARSSSSVSSVSESVLDESVSIGAAVSVALPVSQFGDDTTGWPAVSVCSARSSSSVSSVSESVVDESVSFGAGDSVVVSPTVFPNPSPLPEPTGVEVEDVGRPCVVSVVVSSSYTVSLQPLPHDSVCACSVVTVVSVSDSSSSSVTPSG